MAGVRLPGDVMEGKTLKQQQSGLEICNFKGKATWPAVRQFFDGQVEKHGFDILISYI